MQSTPDINIWPTYPSEARNWFPTFLSIFHQELLSKLFKMPLIVQNPKNRVILGLMTFGYVLRDVNVPTYTSIGQTKTLEPVLSILTSLQSVLTTFSLRATTRLILLVHMLAASKRFGLEKQNGKIVDSLWRRSIIHLNQVSTQRKS
jgi:hypothetical protein